MTSPRPRLTLTTLEDRTVPSSAALGDPWPDSGNLTVSFAPDAARVGDASSSLFRTLNKVARAPDWQVEVLRAFQSWAAVSNLNVGLAADGGQAFGTPGDVQGDYRFGDIRIGARLMSMDTVASAVPFDWTAGTWSGDVLLNTGAKFGIRPRQAGTYDVFTIAAHEAGHSFGLDHSADPLSVMAADYTGTKAGLSASDVANVRALYGARLPDRFEGPGGNGTWDTAMVLSGTGNLRVTADLTTTGDVDYYRFLTPAKPGKFTVDLNTSGLSLLAAKVTVYNAGGKAVGSDVSTDPTNGNLSVRVNHPVGGSFYTVRVASARSDVFGVGRYTLGVSYPGAAAGATALATDSGGTGRGWGRDSAASAGRLDRLMAGSLGGTGGTARGRLSLPSSNLFQFDLNAPGAAGAGVTLTVADATGKTVAAATQTVGGGRAVLSVYLPAGEYTVTLTLTPPAGGSGRVSYVLSGGVLTEPVGPYKTTTSTTPGTTETTPTTAPTTTTTTTTDSATNLYTFVVVPVLAPLYSF